MTAPLAVRFLPKSQNAKLSPVERVPNNRPGAFRKYQLVSRPPYVCSTYASIDRTCSDACPFKHSGCMAEIGFTRVLGRKLEAAAVGMTGFQVARQEAAEIDRAFGGGRIPDNGDGRPRDLRLHVGGDVTGTAAVRVLAAAVKRWQERGGGNVWTFTHRWQDIPARAWGPISVLASVESVDGAYRAIRRGYAPALVVPRFPGTFKAWDLGRGWRAIPCAYETRGLTCAKCRLCVDDTLFETKLAVAFEVHGPVEKRGAALRALGATT